ncbi:hypothetical protein BU26DRAFT_515047 [Trematosphaeria pertusa]|uniref:Uncharacterized protein n=1 Tax=Trematosphaeria pertusa TaxID=390896 RepID=A0A6A6J1J6_9PLEO|nr:uncharacterized protein BU26DRAFT_515047 [Trematosphaeria pertusa]KAF2255323.1 hypothetical protein BU26DRAFT_515047 [Trematosphaeria pertusa]
MPSATGPFGGNMNTPPFNPFMVNGFGMGMPGIMPPQGLPVNAPFPNMSRASNYAGGMPSAHGTPALYAPAPQRVAHFVPGPSFTQTPEAATPPKTLSAVPTGTGRPNTLKVVKQRTAPSTRAASAGPSASATGSSSLRSKKGKGKAKEEQQPGPSTDVKNSTAIQHIEALQSSALPSVRVRIDARFTRHNAEKANFIQNRENLLSRLDGALTQVRAEEKEMVGWQDRAIASLTVATTRTGGDKDKALKNAAECMKKASYHSEEARRKCDVANAYRAALDDLGFRAMTGLERFYRGVFQEVRTPSGAAARMSEQEEKEVRAFSEWRLAEKDEEDGERAQGTEDVQKTEQAGVSKNKTGDGAKEMQAGAKKDEGEKGPKMTTEHKGKTVATGADIKKADGATNKDEQKFTDKATATQKGRKEDKNDEKQDKNQQGDGGPKKKNKSKNKGSMKNKDNVDSGASSTAPKADGAKDIKTSSATAKGDTIMDWSQIGRF